MQELPVKVGGIIYKRDTEGNVWYLLLKRTKNDGDFWQYMTGTLHEGESFLDCLQREMHEEVGITNNQILSIDSMFYSFTRCKKDGKLMHDFTYSIQVSPDFSPKLSPLEHDDYIWERFDNAIQTLYTDNNKNALRALYNTQYS